MILVKKVIDCHVNHACNLNLLSSCIQLAKDFGVFLTAVCAIILKSAITSLFPQNRQCWTVS